MYGKNTIEKENHDVLDILITKNNELQIVINKTEEFEQEDIIRIKKSVYEELLGSIDMIEQFDDVTIILIKINISYINEKLRKTIGLYRTLDLFSKKSMKWT